MGRQPLRLDLNWLLLGLLWLIHAISLVLWLRLDQRFPTGEAASQLTTALRVADALSRPALDLPGRIAAAQRWPAAALLPGQRAADLVLRAVAPMQPR